MQYLLGLERLGHEVLLVEPVAGREEQAQTPLGSSASAAYLRELPPDVTARCALLRGDTRETVGLPYGELERFARTADLLLNISGMLRDERLIRDIPIRAYLDLDPGFNQVWNATGEDLGFDGHTHFVTVGQAIETGAVNWTYVIVTIVVLFASIRAIEATLKLIGRFATTKRADN